MDPLTRRDNRPLAFDEDEDDLEDDFLDDEEDFDDEEEPEIEDIWA